MNEEPLDNALKNRIREVFDHYEDDTADEGWQLLRKKFPEEKDEDGVVIWLSRVTVAAAILFMVFNIWLWISFRPVNKEKVTKIIHTTIHHPATIDSLVNNPIFDSGLAEKKQPNKKINSSFDANYTNSLKPATRVFGKNSHVIIPQPDTNKKEAIAFFHNYNTNSLAVIDSPTKTTNLHTNVDIQKKEIARHDSTQISSAMQSLFDEEKKRTIEEKIFYNKPADKTLKLGIYAATFVNYAKGSNKQFNTGAGLTSDIRITSNISLSTGLSVAQNSLNYSNISTNSPVALVASLSHNFQPNTNMLAQVVPATKTLDANLVNLDVPVNLKYIFNPQSGASYISAGLSSGTFLSENYNYNYNYTSPNNGTEQQSQEETNHAKAFNNFYFAKLLNLSFGIGYPVGKNNLVIEPFVKYPLTGLGQQQILFGSGGINLKFNFGKK